MSSTRLIGPCTDKHNTNPQTSLDSFDPFTSIVMKIQFRQVVSVLMPMVVSAAVATAQFPTSALQVSSPDARTEVVVATVDGHLVYSVRRDGRALVLPSMLGFEFRGAPALRDSLRVTATSTKTYDSTWTQPWGEVARVRDHHNELRVSVAETSAPARKFDVVFRAFTDGLGF